MHCYFPLNSRIQMKCEWAASFLYRYTYSLLKVGLCPHKRPVDLLKKSFFFNAALEFVKVDIAFLFQSVACKHFLFLLSYKKRASSAQPKLKYHLSRIKKLCSPRNVKLYCILVVVVSDLSP